MNSSPNARCLVKRCQGGVTMLYPGGTISWAGLYQVAVGEHLYGGTD